MPLWFVVRPSGPDGAPELWAWTFAKSQKMRNLERDPRATLQIETGEEYQELRGVMLETDVVDPPRRRRRARASAWRSSGATPPGVDGELADEVVAMVARAGREARRLPVRRAPARDLGPPQARRRLLGSSRCCGRSTSGATARSRWPTCARWSSRRGRRPTCRRTSRAATSSSTMRRTKDDALRDDLERRLRGRVRVRRCRCILRRAGDLARGRRRQPVPGRRAHAAARLVPARRPAAGRDRRHRPSRRSPRGVRAARAARSTCTSRGGLGRAKLPQALARAHRHARDRPQLAHRADARAARRADGLRYRPAS